MGIFLKLGPDMKNHIAYIIALEREREREDRRLSAYVCEREESRRTGKQEDERARE